MKATFDILFQAKHKSKENDNNYYFTIDKYKNIVYSIIIVTITIIDSKTVKET